MKNLSTIRSREAVRKEAALAVLRSKARGDRPEALEDLERMALAVDLLCDVVANLEFHRG